MKRYTEYTINELANLNEKETEDLISLECLHEGVKIPIKPIEPIKPILEPRDECYSIRECTILMKDKEAIEEISSVLQKHQDKFLLSDYRWRGGWGSDHRYLKNKEANDFSVSKTKFFVEGDIDKNGSVLDEYNRLKTEYDKFKKEYDIELTAYSEISSKVKAKIEEACRHVYLVDSYAKQFKNYMRLSDHDLDTAKKFFLQANGHTKDMIEEIIEKSTQEFKTEIKVCGDEDNND